jgi:hypothetical protein
LAGNLRGDHKADQFLGFAVKRAFGLNTAIHSCQAELTAV